MNNLITSIKFAEISSVIFSGVFLPDQIKSLNIKNYKKVNQFGKYLYIRNYNFQLKENDIIFSRIEDLKLLFYLLSDVNLVNIKIICHHSDLSLTKNIFKKKPKCVSKIYSVNVDHISDKLISIPIGIANKHEKNLKEEDFVDIQNPIENNFSGYFKKNLLFVNFQESTNYKVRSGIYEIYKKQEWARVEKPTLKKETYINFLGEANFTLTPYGNGYDTHRFWEALYAGSIPVLEYHVSYNYAEDLPVLFVDDIKNVNESILRDYINNLDLKKIKFEKLFFEYWNRKITKEMIHDDKEVLISKKNLIITYFELKYYLNFWLMNKRKKLIFYHIRIKKKLSQLTYLVVDKKI